MSPSKLKTGTGLIFPVFLFSHSYQMKAIYGYEKGYSIEARVCTERWLAILCQKKNQPDSFGIKHGRNPQLPGLMAAYRSHSTQDFFQVTEKSLENTFAHACLKASSCNYTLLMPPSLTQPKMLLSCYTIKTSSLALGTLQDCSSGRQEMPADSKCKAGGSVSPSPKGRPHTGFPANPNPSSNGLETILFILNPRGKTK